LARGQLDSVWVPDEATEAMRRRRGRRRQLIVTRSKAKNEVHGALMRRLVRKPKVSDLFGIKGRRWLERLELPAAEREIVDGCLRQLRDRSLPEPKEAGRLPRPRSDRPPVGIERRSSRADLKAGLGSRTLCAGRGRLVGRPGPRSAARLL
jgi:transposase